MLNRKRATRAGMTAVPASFISFGGIWSGTVDLFIFSNSTFLRSDRWDPVISLSAGGSALRCRIKSGSRHSIAVGAVEVHQLTSLLLWRNIRLSKLLHLCNQSSSTYCSNLNCIYLLQKRIVRLISKTHYLANTAPLFSKLTAVTTNTRLWRVFFLSV